MLIDRCLMTKHGDEWVGLVEVRQRSGERWRFVAWLSVMVCAVEIFRLGQISFWFFSVWEYTILLLSAFAAVGAFRRAGKLLAQREIAFRIPPPIACYDEDEQLINEKRHILLSSKDGFDSYNIDRFTHVVFGLIDLPMPGRQSVTIEAYALYLAETDGTPRAIIEGAFDKHSCFLVAKRVAALTKLPLIELGKGHPFVSHDTLPMPLKP